MKIGRLVVGRKNKESSGTVIANLGDNIQTLSVDRIVSELFPNNEVVDINIYELPSYKGEKVLLPLNCYLLTCGEGYVLPASKDIIPVFLAVSFCLPPTLEGIEYLKKYSPIGCRDYSTYVMMQKYGIPAYLSGCTTFTLPKRKVKQANKIFAVDVPEELVQYIPKCILDKIEFISQAVTYSTDNIFIHKLTDEQAIKLYERYKNEAKLVITSRLHCAQPCIAMGIPVIIVRKRPSPRFEFVNQLSHVYLPSEYGNIDWNPVSVDIEKLKQHIKNAVRVRLLQKEILPTDYKWLTSFWDKSKEHLFPSVEDFIVKSVLASGAKKWILWGARGPTANYYYDTMSKKCSNIKLVAVIDQLKKMKSFNEIETVKADDIKDFSNTFILVSTLVGSEEAKQYLESHGLVEGKDFLTAAILN